LAIGSSGATIPARAGLEARLVTSAAGPAPAVIAACTGCGTTNRQCATLAALGCQTRERGGTTIHTWLHEIGSTLPLLPNHYLYGIIRFYRGKRCNDFAGSSTCTTNAPNLVCTTTATGASQ
jgi:hypothetical protein